MENSRAQLKDMVQQLNKELHVLRVERGKESGYVVLLVRGLNEALEKIMQLEEKMDKVYAHNVRLVAENLKL